MVIFGLSDKLKKRAKRRGLDTFLVFKACAVSLFCKHTVNKLFICSHLLTNVKKMKNEKEKITITFAVRINKEIKEWFLAYLKTKSIGVNTSEQFRNFILALKHKDIPQVSVIESAIKCERLQRALRHFCLKCKTQMPPLFKICPNRDWRQTQLRV